VIDGPLDLTDRFRTTERKDFFDFDWTHERRTPNCAMSRNMINYNN
jgi:hypothetical protein